MVTVVVVPRSWFEEVDTKRDKKLGYRRGSGVARVGGQCDVSFKRTDFGIIESTVCATCASWIILTDILFCTAFQLSRTID